MKYYGYKVLLSLLRILVYLKRGVVSFGQTLLWLGQKMNSAYMHTIGFRLYKIWFTLKKRLEKYKIPLDGRLVELFGKRGTLQVLFFIIVLFLIYPESRLYSRDTTQLPGRQTVLYRLIGPGDQDFSDETEILEESGLEGVTPLAFSPGWREGTVGVDSTSPAVGTIRISDITGISAGGSAVVKPTIIPGAALPTVADGDASSKRTETLVYEVQAGDVIGNIAVKFGISVNTILWANDLSVRSYIRPGDELKILPVDGLIHKVQRGDTVGKIARLYNAETQSIVDFNRLQKDGADIVIGEELLVPGGEKANTSQRLSTVPVRKFTPLSSIAAPPPSVAAPAGSGFIWPTSVRRISQYFGLTHTGVDIAGPVGTPLYAAKAGKVVKSQCGWNGGYGCYVIIDHGGGVNTLYGHASQLYVQVGDAVEQGTTIALMGSTGRSTGPHIHFEVRVNGVRANPLKYVR